MPPDAVAARASVIETPPSSRSSTQLLPYSQMCTPEVRDWQERSRESREYSRLCVQSTTACADETAERGGGIGRGKERAGWRAGGRNSNLVRCAHADSGRAAAAALQEGACRRRNGMRQHLRLSKSDFGDHHGHHFGLLCSIEKIKAKDPKVGVGPRWID
eukprot:2587252-Pleurochrysis_carterae.AAC.1